MVEFAAAPGGARASFEPAAQAGVGTEESDEEEPAALAEAALPRLWVSGRVVDETGAPIEGAEVLGRGVQDGFRFLARTDASGAFAGELARTHFLSFHVFAAGHARGERIHHAEVRESLDLGTIVLAPGGEVYGRVLEEGGRAPRRARVAVAPASMFPAEDFARPETLDAELGEETVWIEAGAEGVFELRGVPPGEWFLVAEGPGGVGWSQPFTLVAGAGVVADVLVPRADESQWITGRVLGPGGTPLEAVELVLVGERELALGWGEDTTSALDGSYCFELDEPGVFTLRARDPHLRAATLEVAHIASGRRELELVLPPLPWVEVRLVDEHERPIAWGNVWSSGGDSHVPLTPLGERGVGRIPFAGRTLALGADAPGFARTEFGPYSPADVERGLVLGLVPGGFVRGRITSGGRGVPGARLDLTWARAPGESRASRGTAPEGWPFGLTNHVALSGNDGTSDGDGRFTLSIPNAGWQALRVEGEGFPLTVFGPWELDPAGASPELELVLERGGALEGRILVAPGESPLGRFVGVSNGWSFAHTTAVDAEGRYRFANLAPGSWQVRPVEPPVAALQSLEFSRDATEFLVEPDVEVHPGATARFELDLTRTRGCALAGHFRFDGVDLDGWHVTLAVEGPQGRGIVAGGALARDGSFRVVAARPGTYFVQFGHEQRLFRRAVELVGAESTLELAFARAVALVDPPVGDEGWLRIEGTCADGTAFEAWSWCDTEDERWRVEVPAGSLRVREGKSTPSAPVELAPGEERVLALPAR